MLIYTMTSNKGGMKRVAESAMALLSDLPPEMEFRVFIFSKRPIEMSSPNLYWIEWDEDNHPYSKENITRYQSKVNHHITSSVSYVIGDYMTLAYFEHLKARVIYDVHILGRPLFAAMDKSEGLSMLDRISKFPISAVLGLTSFHFLKFEAKYISKAEAFIVNSENSKQFLKTYYRDEVQGKEMFYIPVASELPSVDEVFEKKISVYNFGRFHPQKGLHLLLKEDWKAHPLFIRGINLGALNPYGSTLMKEKNITALPWAWDSSELTRDLLSSRLVIFPAIYEPWGLAMQEALSLGCTCLANKNSSGHEEQIEDGVNGFLVDMNESHWFGKIKDIFSLSSEENSRISEKAKKTAISSFKPRNAIFLEYIKKLNEKIKTL